MPDLSQLDPKVVQLLALQRVQQLLSTDTRPVHYTRQQETKLLQHNWTPPPPQNTRQQDSRITQQQDTKLPQQLDTKPSQQQDTKCPEQPDIKPPQQQDTKSPQQQLQDIRTLELQDTWTLHQQGSDPNLLQPHKNAVNRDAARLLNGWRKSSSPTPNAAQDSVKGLD